MNGRTIAAVRGYLRADAKNRAWRTMLQGFVAIVGIPAADAALQVLVDAVKGGTFDVGRTFTLAGISALTAALIAMLSYVHRLKLDPSAVPSATPPVPPISMIPPAPRTSYEQYGEAGLAQDRPVDTGK